MIEIKEEDGKEKEGDGVEKEEKPHEQHKEVRIEDTKSLGALNGQEEKSKTKKETAAIKGKSKSEIEEAISGDSDFQLDLNLDHSFLRGLRIMTRKNQANPSWYCGFLYFQIGGPSAGIGSRSTSTSQDNISSFPTQNDFKFRTQVKDYVRKVRITMSHKGDQIPSFFKVICSIEECDDKLNFNVIIFGPNACKKEFPRYEKVKVEGEIENNTDQLKQSTCRCSYVAAKTNGRTIFDARNCPFKLCNPHFVSVVKLEKNYRIKIPKAFGIGSGLWPSSNKEIYIKDPIGRRWPVNLIIHDSRSERSAFMGGWREVTKGFLFGIRNSMDWRDDDSRRYLCSNCKQLGHNNGLVKPSLLAVQRVLVWGLGVVMAETPLLYDQDSHRSEVIWHGEDPGCLECTEHFQTLRLWPVDERMLPYIKATGFGALYRVQWLRLDKLLITALVERWRSETNTFHLANGEMTITLEDVVVLLGLCVDGDAVTGSTRGDWMELARVLLGVELPPRSFQGGRLSLSWIKGRFSLS
ncbi:hypothetical protein H6P81_006049 [Aristolochia fimbriata]|uniref:Aminotransferase-like plant mobile domain-containing protein n=1 Tax=Aristolochia fimbriata TaxID=158543 RepID=A0AAV7EYE5_ARIFI|nr:hypothetical protein H6P81_006049 [Aristolochia fimbriata]